ncbi:hypothetical protein LTS15_007798 [Exophiala xenobiotica]|nr:hypothetical protein LTS15_007798 [Exophiala xenobiotica]
MFNSALAKASFVVALLVFGLAVNVYHNSPILFETVTHPLSSEQDQDDSPHFNASIHRKLFSLSTPDRQYFDIDFGDYGAYNPNIIPHPTRSDAYLVVASAQTDQDNTKHTAVACTAAFVDGSLRCVSKPSVLPVKLTEGHCKGDLTYFNWKPGPRDSRVFWGPDRPYIVYNTLATRSCLGLFVQDLGALIPEIAVDGQEDQIFNNGTEMQRPAPYETMQKNWFLFWDAQDQAYVHQDFYPKRTYTRLAPDGSVGFDLSIDARQSDAACLAKYVPKLHVEGWEHIHQATNSLMVTLCKRSDPSCSPSDDNTFIMTIFQHKTYFEYHPEYYPYVMLFRRGSPFAVHAVSEKSLWIHGKTPITNETAAASLILNGKVLPQDLMFYVTSMSWKAHGQRYHGYIDDPLFLGIGIEDTSSAGMDVLAGDLLRDLGYCASTGA